MNHSLHVDIQLAIGVLNTLTGTRKSFIGYRCFSSVLTSYRIKDWWAAQLVDSRERAEILTARVIRRQKVPYLNRLPASLKYFMGMH